VIHFTVPKPRHPRQCLLSTVAQQGPMQGYPLIFGYVYGQANFVQRQKRLRKYHTAPMFQIETLTPLLEKRGERP
jgi:hypothetical protein